MQNEPTMAVPEYDVWSPRSHRGLLARVPLIVLVSLGLIANGQQKRGFTPMPKGSDAVWGEYWALVIGINDYREWPRLITAANDARELKSVLETEYGFRTDHTVLRLDREATLSQIDKDLRAMAEQLGPNDNLFVYFAGHGHIDSLTGDGYWIPVDGKRTDSTSWLGNDRVRAILGAEKVRARNICVVADSCYAGTLLRGTSAPLDVADARYIQKLKELAARKSRQVITSGGKEPVADTGRDGHSLFAWYFLQALKTNAQPAVDLENLLHTRVWEPVAQIGGQRPTIGRLRTPMDEDGQFVLVRRGSRPATGPVAPVKPSTMLVRANFAPPAVAAGAISRIIIQVTSEEGAPLSGVEVTAGGGGRFHETGNPKVTGYTDAKGQFSADWSCSQCTAGYQFGILEVC